MEPPLRARQPGASRRHVITVSNQTSAKLLMEDPWGNNAWSAGDSDKIGDSSNEILDPPKWNTFERDADENTTDVGVPSWSAASGSGWGEGTTLWQTESSLDIWKPSLNSDKPDLKPEVDPKEEEEDIKSPEPRAVLPTPPLSPLPPPSVTPPLAESPPKPLINPPSPDHFGSFESADVLNNGSHDKSSWTPIAPYFPSEATDEPWGAAWGETDDEAANETKGDEWELAQEARRKRDRKVPPELLDSLVKQWDEFAASLNPKSSPEDSEQASWRKGLDTIEGLAELVDSLLPGTSFPPPTPFNKTAVAKSVKETLRLTRSFPLTQSSPMAHLQASKGSTDWEKSVKAQKAAANDEWGWDLKHEPEEMPSATDSDRDKRSGGLLSFWSRKVLSVSSAPVGDSPTTNSQISPTAIPKPTSPMSAHSSTDSSHVVSPTTATPSTFRPPDNVDTVLTDASSPQSSAVSRFFNRFSRKPSAVASASARQEKRTSLSLTSDDLSFLSDMTPSTTEGSLQSPPGSASINSLGGKLSGLTQNSSPSSHKLSPLFGPPSLRSSHPTGHKSTNSVGSETSFDDKMADAQFMDRLDDAMGGGPSSSSGYAPITINLLDSPEKTNVSLPVGHLPDAPVQAAPTSLSSWIPSLMPKVASGTLPPIPPPHSLDGSPKHRQSIASARFHDPLPPTPQRDLDDLTDIFSPSSHSGPPSQLQNVSSPPTKLSPSTSLLSSASNHSNHVSASKESGSADFGDFGDFISTPEDPLKTAKAGMHKPTFELMNKGAARQGRWPALPSPIPAPLAPPPRPSSDMGNFNYPISQQPSQLDLLTSDDSPCKPTSVSGTSSVSDRPATISHPIFARPSSRPASTTFGISPSPPPALSTSSPPLLPSALSKPAGGSGLSAQDLSFFEGL